MKSKVSIIKCAGYKRDAVKTAVKKAVDSIGGISYFVKKGHKVLIKPNLLSAKSPDSIIHTNPEIIRAIVQLVKEAGGIPFIGDAPGSFFTVKAVDKVYEESGMKKVADEEGAELVMFDKIQHVGGYPIAAFVKECDSIISVPKFKTHDLAVITGAIKNTFGLIPGLYKVQCHRKSPDFKDFAKILVDIFAITKPAISIMDAVIGMEGNGPGTAGLARNVGLVMASSDAVSLDAVFSKMVGFEPSRNFVIQEAVKRNLGTGEIDDIEILGEGLDTVTMKDFKLPDASAIYSITNFFLKYLVGFFQFKPVIKEQACTKCEVCVKSCPVDAITINEDKSWINPKTCVKCFCCHEVCPYKAIEIKKNIFARLIWR